VILPGIAAEIAGAGLVAIAGVPAVDILILAASTPRRAWPRSKAGC